ncbi:MAG: hypothetical protein ABW221_21440 [Vicinamibacteria bacterium]
MRFLPAPSRHALLKRLLALAVVLLPVPGGAFSLVVPASASHCGERVCRCAHHCPMTRKPAGEAGKKAAPSCHQEAPLASTFWQPGACGAAQPGAEAPPPVRPHVAEAGTDFTPLPRAVSVRSAERIHPAAGFVEIVLQPPRPNA